MNILPDNRARMSPVDFAAGLSAYRCDNCGKQMSKQVEEKMLKIYWANCNWCGKSAEASTTEVLVLPPYQKFLRASEVTTVEWWHATEHKNWYRALVESHEADGAAPYVHVGSYASACALADLKHSKGKVWYINRIKIDSRAKVSGTVFDDENYWPEDEDDIEGFRGFSEITRYVNRYEIVGSISLLADYRRLKVLETSRLTRQQVRRTLAG